MEKKKILVVDDEPSILRAISVRLNDWGYDVITASDGLHAVTQAHKEKPDLILLDVMMPAGDGFSVCERLRNFPATCAIPVILLTAKPLDEIKELAQNLGVRFYIKKPYDSTKLLQAIEKVFAKETKKV